MSPITQAAERGSYEQRKLVREIATLLREDLYRRDGEDAQFPGLSARWVSPGKWAVTYGYNTDGETIWCRIYGPEGERYAESENADVGWLDKELP